MDEGVVALIRFIATNCLLLAKINVTSHHWQLMQPIIVTWNQSRVPYDNPLNGLALSLAYKWPDKH
jgi:hypothetical protein